MSGPNIPKMGAASAQAAGGGAGGRGGRGGGGLGLGMGGWAKLTAVCIASLACSKIGGQLGAIARYRDYPVPDIKGMAHALSRRVVRTTREGGLLDVANSVERL